MSTSVQTAGRGPTRARTKFKPNRDDKSERWYFQQNTVKILQMTQDSNIVNVTLLRYTSVNAMFSTSTVWKLPFKLDKLRAYLMHPYLSDEEKEELGTFLASIATDQYKFERLMTSRLNAICRALSMNPSVKQFTKSNSPDNNWERCLFSGDTSNKFVQEVLTKNNIKVSFSH